MSEYLDNEVEVDEKNSQEEADDYLTDLTDSEDSLIDNETEGNNLSFYRTVDQLENVGDTESILQEELNKQYKEAENLEPHNLLYEDEVIPKKIELKNQEVSLKNLNRHFSLKIYLLNR